MSARLSRRALLQTAVAAPAIAQGAARKRNIVYILADDHRFDMIGGLGHPWLKTPHLDRLLRQGVHLKNAFVTTALCSPSRASVLTGQYAHTHGVLDNISPLPASLPTFPQLLQERGYRTGFIGKWHMGGESDMPRPGFHDWISFRGQGEYNDPTLNFNGQRRKVPGYVTDLLTDEAERFLQANKSRPFCLYLSHKAVHADFSPAQRHRELYRTEPIPKPVSFANNDETYRGKPEWVRRQRNSWHGVDGMYNHRIQFDDFYRDYCRTLMALDDSVGRVTAELERLGLLNDTLVVYMGDNGFLLGEHGLIDKRCMYEPSMRVPLIAHCPDLFQGGRAVEQMALGMDLCPTFLDVAGVTPPASVHGRSLLPVLQGRQVPWRTEFLYEYFWERDFPQTPTVLGLRTDTHSWMQYQGVWDVDELYNIQADPQQRRNLLADARVRTESGQNQLRITDPQLKELVKDLRARRNRILQETGGLPEPSWRAQRPQG